MSTPFAHSQTVELAELVQVTPDAIVSRTLVKNSAGTVTLFAFGQGQGLSTHSAPFDALVQVLSGQARVTIDGQDHDLTAGQAILMPADIPHSLHATHDFRMLLVMVKGR
jgi:quercetin dioxygenase-like cupin family protein